MYMNNWYSTLKKAPWTPPNYVFGIIWPILYLLMGISFLIVILDKKCYPYCAPITYFLVQLVLNLSWTTIFFRLKQPLIALIDMILIMAITFYTAIRFYPYSKIASLLLVPYLMWLCVAFSLNTYIVLNN